MERRLFRTRRLFLALALLAMLGAWGLAWWHSREVAARAEEDAARQVRQAVQMATAQARLTLAVADEALRRLQDLARKEGVEGFRREGEMLSRGIGNPLNRAALIGADGQMQANFLGGSAAPLLDVRDREYFRHFRQQPEDHIYVSEPLHGKASQVWIIVFARPVLEKGRLQGVIFVGVDVRELARQFEGDFDRGLQVALLSSGGRIIAHSGEPSGAIGQPAAAGWVPDTRLGDGPGPVEGEARLGQTWPVPGWSLQVYAGLSRQQLDNAVREHARMSLLPAGLLSLLLGLAGLFLYRGLRRLERHEATQRREALRSRQILANMGEGVLLLDAAGQVGYANSQASAWLGDCVGRTFAQALAAAEFEIVNEDGEPWQHPDPLTGVCLKAGHTLDAWLLLPQEDRWLQLHAAPLPAGESGRSDAGAATGPEQSGGAVVTLIDRTVEHSRLSESAVTGAVLDNMNDAVLILDARWRIERANPGFCRLSGYEPAALLGQMPQLLRSARHEEDFFTEVNETLRQRDHWSGRQWSRRQDGSEICCWLSINAVRDAHRRVQRYIIVARDITRQELHEQQLWRQANFDPLTGIANRHRFQDSLDKVLAQAQRHGSQFAVCYLDLDLFKQVNDRYGHAAGDALLHQVATRMQRLIRAEDTLARIGGDEFALIVPSLHQRQDAAAVAGKICAALNRPFPLDMGLAEIGVSVGIAIYPDDGRDAAGLLSAADLALYSAKARGRGNFAFAADCVMTNVPAGGAVQ
ncbi:MAG: hypothetical protein RIR00_2347 [Pseudomonadota bacterium]